MENEVLGPAVLKGEVIVLTAMLEDSFGALPEWAKAKLDRASEKEPIVWAKRVRRAPSLDAVFQA